jgi:pilus assembly protein FimV
MRSACALALMLASASASALGLGQIRVLSGPGEPLLAEIPVISSDPAELQALRAALASPETFTRIGLEPPIGAVADLRFATSADAQGRPVIRVTTTRPVTEPMLTFLVEVDWGQGRLVREYSALVATPSSVAAQPAVPVQAPQVQAPPVVERPQAPAPVASAAPAPAPAAAAAPATPSAAPAAAMAAPDSVRVRAGDTLSAIAARVTPEDVSAEQTMVGLLRANPQAFIGGDMNQLRRGSVLRVPAAAELEAIEAREAASLVREYARQWRQARSQPQAPVSRAAAAATAPTPAARVSGGRLEIVPPGAGRATQAGTQSGIAAGGEGEMLRQELQTTKETLAARDAELQELKSRVAELERLQADQQKLIALKDAELAAAQNRPAQPEPAAPARAAGEGSMAPWLGGGVLLLLGLAAVAWARRRRVAPVFRAPVEPRPSIADAFAAVGPAPGEARDVPPSRVAMDPDAAEVAPGASRSAARAAPRGSEAAAPVDAVPSWERTTAARRATPVPAPAGAAGLAPAWAAGEADALAPQVEPANAERLERAQACLDAGDTERARQLLSEVESSDDATARSVASRMRQGLG